MAVVSTETAVIAGAATLVMSKRVRDVLRKGAVYGLAGIISAGDAVVGAAKGTLSSAQEVRHSSDGSAPERSRAATAKA
jgi:hypothetical protein